MRGFSQASPDFSSSRECLVAEKVREKERKGETGENPKTEHRVFCPSLAWPVFSFQQYIKWLYIALQRSENQNTHVNSDYIKGKIGKYIKRGRSGPKMGSRATSRK